MALTKKQKEVFDYIKNYHLENDFSPTQKEIKEHFNLKSFGSVNRYMKYLQDADLIELDWNARRGIKLLKKTEVLNVPAQSFSEGHQYEEIPLLGDIAAGDPIEAIENPTQTTTVPSHMLAGAGRHYALSVRGDSMIEDGIYDGDTLICKYQSTANQGQTIVAVIDDEATVKKYFKHTSYIELHPANERLKPFKITADQHFRINGVVVGLIRSYL